MRQVAHVEVVDWVITVVVSPSARRRTGTAFAGENARKRHCKRRAKARWFGRKDIMAKGLNWAV